MATLEGLAQGCQKSKIFEIFFGLIKDSSVSTLARRTFALRRSERSEYEDLKNFENFLFQLQVTTGKCIKPNIWQYKI